MNINDFFKKVNSEAANLHSLQGHCLELRGCALPEVLFDEAVNELTILYQSQFCYYEKKNPTRYAYAIMPNEPKAPEDKDKSLLSTHIFEVRWLVKALLGIALTRQALRLHLQTRREPGGHEPPDAEERFAAMIKAFLDTP